MSPHEVLIVGGSANTRPIVIFTFYMVLCLSLTILVLRTIHHRRKASLATYSQVVSSHSSSARLIVFAILAFFSLATTWYYMFRFFELSYRTWTLTHNAAHDSSQLQLGRWLRDTKLFKEAWYTALATPARFWWTQQIFFFSIGWSVFIERQGHQFKIPHLWAFMLLGQVVAISFATNLFFLAVLVHDIDVPLSPPSRKQYPAGLPSKIPGARSLIWLPPTALLFHLLAMTFIAVGAIPYTLNSSYFMIILIVPHVMLFFPPMLRGLIPSAWGTRRGPKDAATWYAKVYSGIVICAALLQVKATLYATTGPGAQGNDGALGAIFAALYEHPAVSSVGWDVIFCWVSWIIWVMSAGWTSGDHQFDLNQTNKKEM